MLITGESLLVAGQSLLVADGFYFPAKTRLRSFGSQVLSRFWKVPTNVSNEFFEAVKFEFVNELELFA